MKTALILDSACSLPKRVCEKYNISLLPIAYSVDNEEFTDDCNEQSALALFESGIFSRKHDVRTTPPTAEDFEQAIIEKIKQGFSQVIVQTVNRTQGETYENANAGIARVKQQLEGQQITMRVMDSRTVFAGQGLMATETVRRMLRSNDETAVRRQMDKMSEKIHTYILPKEPLIALERSRQRNESSIGWTQALLANKLGIHPIICNVNDASESVGKVWGFKKAAKALFHHAIKCIDAGVYSPIVTINYCGDLAELKELPGYSELEEKAEEKKLMLIPSVASLAGGIYTSVGSLSIALATETHSWSS